jgi:uncharacterized protein YbaP (TraB family)
MDQPRFEKKEIAMNWIKKVSAVVLMFVVTLSAPVFAATLPVATVGQGEPALWMAKGAHGTVYLFGSVHVLRKDAPWRSAKIDAAIKASGSLWLEIPDPGDQSAAQALVMKYGVDREHPLSTVLTKEQLAKLDTVATAAAIPGGEAGMEPLKPWLAAIMLSVMPMMKAGFDPSSGVELVLKPEFEKAGKPVHGFETQEQQFHYLADLPEKVQVDYLNSTVQNYDKGADAFKQIVAAWYAGDDKAIDQFFSGDFRAVYPEVYKALLVDRNVGFAKQIDGLLKGEGTSFVAVGAGHLVGPDGVVALLEKMGYTVARQ